MINDTVEVGRTDLKGFFQIDIPVSEKKILFEFVGMDPTTIELIDKCDKIEIVMMYIHTYDFITLKRARGKGEKDIKSFLRYINKLLRKVYLKLNMIAIIASLNPFMLKEN